jgi:16S rRNA (uracil1498-N3)-methyltransferase
MARFFIPPAAWKMDDLALADAEAHHCRDVLRLAKGDRATVFNGRGVEATVEIGEAARDRIPLRVLQQTRTPPLPAHITLAQAIPKGKNMELIIEKATELGASSIAPLISDRTIVQIDASDALRKQEKWQRVTIEAAKQCGQNWLPEIQMPRPLKAFFEAGTKFDLMLIASLQHDAQHLKRIIAEFGARPPTRALILVGPEGDFTPAELALAKSAGCRPITLGPIILRTETAAIYCLSVLSHELFSGGL